MSQPLTHSDLIFPAQSLSISSTLSSLKRSALSTHNRLLSIQADSEFVASVSEAFGLPLVANERCGSWYIAPEKKAESAYFKSTDGHTNEWKFSVRRLNLQVLDLVGKRGGCVIVDSTRRGKSMPDALSKTIPIWCCVMNRVLFPESGHHELHTPPQAVSESEHSQIKKRIDGFVRNFKEICQPDIATLRSKLQKPLRPIWVTQKSSLPDTPPSFPDFHPIVLCTASRRVNGAEGSEGGYIQGAADDHEAWSQGLTPTLFWSHKDTLLATNEEDFSSLIKKLVEEETGPKATPILIKPTSTLYISSSQNLDITPFDVIISCTPEPLPGHTCPAFKDKKYLWLQCQTGKLGSRDLRTQLQRLLILETWLSSRETAAKILICDPTGKDLAVGVALAILCTYAEGHGALSFNPGDRRAKIDKSLTKQRLAWLTTTHPSLNPSRATLQAVNAFLMPGPEKWHTPPPAVQPPRHEGEGGGPKPAPCAAEANVPPLPPSNRSPTTLLSADVPNPAKIFAALASTWTFTRTLTSALPSHPSGTVTGTATFSPHPSTPSTLLLYAEEGEFVTTTGLPFTIHQRYLYQLKQRGEGEEYIAVYFPGKKGEEVGGLFVEMETLRWDEGLKVKASNREQHLCAKDVYRASWEFGWEQGEMWWKVRYDVSGPKKEYVSETTYTKG